MTWNHSNQMDSVSCKIFEMKVNQKIVNTKYKICIPPISVNIQFYVDLDNLKLTIQTVLNVAANFITYFWNY